MQACAVHSVYEYVSRTRHMLRWLIFIFLNNFTPYIPLNTLLIHTKPISKIWLLFSVVFLFGVLPCQWKLLITIFFWKNFCWIFSPKTPEFINTFIFSFDFMPNSPPKPVVITCRALEGVGIGKWCIRFNLSIIQKYTNSDYLVFYADRVIYGLKERHIDTSDIEWTMHYNIFLHA